MRVQHRNRRRGLHGDPGTILVGGTKYTIDEDGQVEVSEEHGAMMLQGAGWVAAGQTLTAGSSPKSLAADVPHVPGPDREREDLLKKAEELGLKPDRRLAKHKIASAIKAEEERRKDK